MTFIKVPYQLLSDNCTSNGKHVEQYLLFKQSCSAAKKSGFIRKGELQQIAKTTGTSIKTLYRLLKQFKNLGWLHVTTNGYQLPNLLKINRNNNLSLNTKTSTKKGYEYVPFFKLASTDIKFVEEIKIAYLLNQVASRYNYQQSANKTKPLDNTANAGFTVSIDKLRIRGNYNSNTTVYRVLKSAEQLKLVKVIKNGFNSLTNKYNCNQYLINNYHWSTGIAGLESLDNVLPKKVKRKSVFKKLRIPKPLPLGYTPEPLNEQLEAKFRLFIKKAKGELIENGFLKYSFLNKKVSRRSYSLLLTRIMNSSNWLKTVLLEFLGADSIKKETKTVQVNKWNENKYKDFDIQYMPLGKHSMVRTVTDYRYSLNHAA